MIVVTAEEGNLETYPNDDGAFLNVGSTSVILKLPTISALGQYWEEFQEELRLGFLELLSMPHHDVVAAFGQLGHNVKNNASRGENLFGLAPRALVHRKGLMRVKHEATLKAIVEAKLLSFEECSSRRFKLHSGTASFLNSLEKKGQRLFFNALLQPHCNLDEILRFNQGCQLGLEETERLFKRRTSSQTFLESLASQANNNLKMNIGTRNRKGGGTRCYAPIWFAIFLAKKGIWLLPLTMVQNATAAFPAWTKPVQCWLSFPNNLRAFANALMRDHLVSKRTQSDPLVIEIATRLAWSSNVWNYERLCAGPLIGYKKFELSGPEISKNGSNSQRSWAINRVWEAQLDLYGCSPLDHPDSHAFTRGKRLVSKGTRAFDWVRAPNKRNLKTYQRLYGRYETEFPDWLVAWADELEQLLPLFNVESIEQKIKPLNLWLLYLAGSANPPRSLMEISRHKHIVGARDMDGEAYIQFLKIHFKDQQTRNAGMAMSTLRQAWALAADLEGFSSKLSNPIDNDDSPIRFSPRGSRTTRSALDAKVTDIIIRENLREDMAFARALGTCTRLVRSPETGNLIEVFFPGPPVVINTILHSGMRGMQARWLDSGEGDEEVLDAAGLKYCDNPNSIAIKGRREGFLRLCHVMGDSKSRVVGMWINSGKTGPHEVPWVHEAVIEPILQLAEFQKNFYPISTPVEIEKDLNFDSQYKKKKGKSFPLARDPENKIGHPISKQRLTSYFKALLVHCQPIIDDELGYHYPLFGLDGQCLFDLHSLRVTIITTLLENGVPAYVVQMLVGHKSPIMTWYYRDVTNYKVHSALQNELERRKSAIKQWREGSNSENLGHFDDAISFRDEKDFVGLEMLKAHGEMRSSIDVFSHGICPAGNCETGGKRLMPGRYGPVWRPRACSGCRYRVTGPAFLNGLVHRSNTLLWEIRSSTRKEADLFAAIEVEEDAGRPTAYLRSNVRQEQELRDHLYEEWAIEVRTINSSRRVLGASVRDEKKNSQDKVMADFDPTEAEVRIREVHEFELAQRLTQDADLIQSNIDLPPDVVLYRDQILHRVAHANSIHEYFFRLNPETARDALNRFGEMLVSHSSSVDELNDVIDGTLLIEEIPKLREALMVSGVGQSPLSLTDGNSN